MIIRLLAAIANAIANANGNGNGKLARFNEHLSVSLWQANVREQHSNAMEISLLLDKQKLLLARATATTADSDAILATKTKAMAK